MTTPGHADLADHPPTPDPQRGPGGAPSDATPGASARSSADAVAVSTTDLPLPGRRAGKVRDVYSVPASGPDPERVVLVATDRLSAFDVVMPTPVPGKGRMLTSLSAFWLGWIAERGLAETYLTSLDPADLPGYTPGAGGWPGRAVLEGRVTIGHACEVIPIECVVRGYLEGSGWRDYMRTGSVCGHELPPGLDRCARLPRALFTPATKARDGEHDENIDASAAAAHVGPIAARLGWTGEALLGWLGTTSVRIYTEAAAYALERGIIIADTKFEFGIPLGSDTPKSPVLIDEALTPDSSRFWPAATYQAGRTQASFDKQYVREYLEALVGAGAWDKRAPGPELPERVVEGTLARYREACDLLMS